MQTIITFILIFGLIVLVHEWGHFYFAKKAGVRVLEFAIGMGPKVFQKQHQGTTYTLRLLPVGGYVRMANRAEADEARLRPGMTVTVVMADEQVTRINLSEQVELVGGRAFIVDDADLVDAMQLQGYFADDATENLVKLAVDHDAWLIEADGTEVLVTPRDTLFESAKLWQRILINFAGPMNNFLLTLALFVGIAFVIPGVTTTTIDHVAPKMPAQAAGLKSGDKITAVAGNQVNGWPELSGVIQSVPGQTVKVAYERDGKAQTTEVKVAKKKIEDQAIGQIGITPTVATGIGARLGYAWDATKTAAMQIIQGIRSLFGNFSLNKLGGPVAIYKNTEQVSQLGLLTIVYFTAMLSINLGLMNLLPIPALDGGKLCLNAIEFIIRRPVPAKVEVAVTVVGAVFLLVLMLAVTGNDIMRYFIK